MSLKDPKVKMSKSHLDPRSRINLIDTHKEIGEKIRLALTDSIPDITYDPVNRPGVSNLLAIWSHLDTEGRSPWELATDCCNLGMRGFKDRVCMQIVGSLRGVRERYSELMDGTNAQYLEAVREEGSIGARLNAEHTLKHIKTAIGLL
jgi:tryptophanyl-tRNA synthetase